MTKTIQQCDHCGVSHGDTNHWFKVDTIEHNGWREIRLITDIASGVEMSGDDACGEECALKLASKLLRGVGVAA